MTNLNPCPFCGSAATMFTMPEGSGSDGSMYIECDNGLCRASSAFIYPLKDDVKHILVERWNRRPISNLEGSVSTLESECNQLNDLSIKQREIIDNLASMCRRLSYSVKRSGNDKLAHECVILLKKYDLGGSVLRNMEGPAELCPKPAQGFEIDHRGVLVKAKDK